MPQYSIQPPSEKIKKALKELSEILIYSPEKTRWEVLQLVELKYDLSPQECEFLNNQFKKEEK